MTPMPPETTPKAEQYTLKSFIWWTGIVIVWVVFTFIAINLTPEENSRRTMECLQQTERVLELLKQCK